MHNDNFINYNALLKLAVRECITDLCNNSKNTINLLKQFNHQNLYILIFFINLKFFIFKLWNKFFVKKTFNKN